MSLLGLVKLDSMHITLYPLPALLLNIFRALKCHCEQPLSLPPLSPSVSYFSLSIFSPRKIWGAILSAGMRRDGGVVLYTEVEGRREMTKHGVLPCLDGGEGRGEGKG